MDPDPAPDPAIFVIDLQDANKKIICFSNFFCLFLFEGTFTSFFKDRKSKRSHKAVGIKFFSYYFCLMMEGSGFVPLTSVADPDPQVRMFLGLLDPDLDPLVRGTDSSVIKQK
jgi:hypothetical protein